MQVEADSTAGIPGFIMTGALSPETREAQYRVWNAIRNSGIRLEPRKITVNISPASERKEGTAYDLPVALAVLCSAGALPQEGFDAFAFLGETGLDGTVKKVRGVLPAVLSLRDAGFRRVFVPAENAAEAVYVEGIACTAVATLKELFAMLKEGDYPDAEAKGAEERQEEGSLDFSEVSGQRFLRRAAEIAVSGRHNILFSGPAGTGKTMIARRMPTILPRLTPEEDLDISKVYSICGLLPPGRALLSRRPFRAPHHGISQAAFTGGGPQVLPGEMSLASGGILFLDELPLFPRATLETMRQPLEERRITVTRIRGSYTYPADFELVAAMNNCACGYYPDRRRCSCTPAQVKAYMGHLSRPLLERIDICAEARPVGYEEIAVRKKEKDPAVNECSAEIRKRVERAHALQKERFRDEEGILFNSRMGIRQIERYCALGVEEDAFMKECFQNRGLSGRTYHKILKVARTIADMEEEERIGLKHLAEAVELRSIEDKLFSVRREAFL